MLLDHAESQVFSGLIRIIVDAFDLNLVLVESDRLIEIIGKLRLFRERETVFVSDDERLIGTQA